MKMIVKQGVQSAAVAAAELIIEWSREAIDLSGRCYLALSGGTTPKPLYRLLASEYAKALDWNKVLFFFVDERTVPPEDPESNYGMIKKLLLDPLGVPAINVFRMKSEWKNRNNAAQQYEATIIKTCPKSPDGIPSFDICLLGVGEDGHTASIFPGTKAAQAKKYYVMTNFVPVLDTSRLTLTPPILDASRRVLFFVTGAAKAPIIKAIKEDREMFPAGRIEGRRETLWVIDQAAASS